MNIDRVSQGVQLAANAGVILSIVFLAYQIGEQRELMKAQTRIAISSTMQPSPGFCSAFLRPNHSWLAGTT